MKKNIIYLSLLFSNVFSEKSDSIIDSVINICSSPDTRVSQEITPSKGSLEKDAITSIGQSSLKKEFSSTHNKESSLATPMKTTSHKTQETKKESPIDGKNTESINLTFIDNIIDKKKIDYKKKTAAPGITYNKKKSVHCNNYNLQKKGVNRYNINRKFVEKRNKKTQKMLTLKKLKNSCAKRHTQEPTRVSHRIYNQ